MRFTIKAPERISADIRLPASKSVSNRALIINALSGNNACPCNLSDCDDTDVIVRALAENPYEIDIKGAGTAMRFLTAYLAATEGSHLLTGTERMRQRPIGVLVDALRFLGADIRYAAEEGYPPLVVNGKSLAGGRVEVLGSVSSQYVSALLMIGPMLRNGLELKLVGNVISRPYIDLTLWMMNEFGARAEWADIDTITVEPVPYSRRDYLIESDWSAASYWYEMMVLGTSADDSILLRGLNDGSRQGDSTARYIFSLLGVKTVFETLPDGQSAVRLRRTRMCVPKLEYNFVNTPDLAQTFIACCCALGVPFHFAGLQTLAIKETDRIMAMKAEMHKLGFVLRDIDGSAMVWDGTRCQPRPEEAVATYEDHRMAMALAPLTMRLGAFAIDDPEVVCKSYPNFWTDMHSAGFDITEE